MRFDTGKGLGSLPKMKDPRSHGVRLEYEKQANITVLNSPSFKKACKEAGTPVTKRQAAKFRKGKGLAFRCK